MDGLVVSLEYTPDLSTLDEMLALISNVPQQSSTVTGAPAERRRRPAGGSQPCLLTSLALGPESTEQPGAKRRRPNQDAVVPRTSPHACSELLQAAQCLFRRPKQRGGGGCCCGGRGGAGR